MGITIKDIAKDLNLSKTTVSFVLSGIGPEKGISKKTQERILSYADKYKYQPNLLAKSLHSGISNTIGVVVPSIGDVFYAELVREIEKEAKKRGCLITICSTERDPLQEVKIIRMLKAQQVDGLIIAPTEYCELELKSLLNDHFPFVLIDRFFPNIETNYVVIDDFQTSVTLVRNLINQDKKKIALITIDSNITAIERRTEGYIKALENANIPVDDALICKVKRNDYVEDIVNVLDNLLETVPDVDAFYFTAHYLAFEAIMYFIERNRSITDYGLACIHQNPIFKNFAHGMEIARIPIEKMGYQAVNILLDKELTNKESKIGCMLSAPMIKIL